MVIWVKTIFKINPAAVHSTQTFKNKDNQRFKIKEKVSIVSHFFMIPSN